MPTEPMFSTEVICTLITLSGVLISSTFSWLIARHTSKSETKKLEAAWKHQRDAEYEDLFSRMVVFVTRFIHERHADFSGEAHNAIALVQAIEPGHITDLLHQMHDAIATWDRKRTDDLLRQIIEKNRQKQGASNAKKRCRTQQQEPLC